MGKGFATLLVEEQEGGSVVLGFKGLDTTQTNLDPVAVFYFKA